MQVHATIAIILICCKTKMQSIDSDALRYGTYLYFMLKTWTIKLIVSGQYFETWLSDLSL